MINTQKTIITLQEAKTAFSRNLQEQIYSEIMVRKYADFEQIWDELMRPNSQKSNLLLLQAETDILQQLPEDSSLYAEFLEWINIKKEKGAHSFFRNQSIPPKKIRIVNEDLKKINDYKEKLGLLLQKNIKPSYDKNKEKLTALLSEQDKCIGIMWLASWNIFDNLKMDLSVRVSCAKWLKTEEAMHLITKSLLPEAKPRSLSPLVSTTTTTLSPPVMRRVLSQQAKGNNKAQTEEPLQLPIQIPITPLFGQFMITLTPPYKQDQEEQKQELDIQELIRNQNRRGSRHCAAPDN